MKVYGPYTRKDGRKHVILYDPKTQKRTTVSYPKYLMEQHLGRKLGIDKTVDHIDDDFTNDDLGNLQILTRLENVKKSHLLRPAEFYIFECPICKVHFKSRMSDYRYHQEKKGKAGPFCSKTCAGVYGTDVQNNRA